MLGKTTIVASHTEQNVLEFAINAGWQEALNSEKESLIIKRIIVLDIINGMFFRCPGTY